MKTFIVSGAGAGIGRAIATSLSSVKDSQVVLIGRSQKSLEETQQQLERPDQHIILPVSTTDAQGLAAAFREIDLSQISGVVANAGVGGPNIYGPDDRWDEVISINVKGSYILANEALPYLKKSSEEFRHVLVLSSVVAQLGVPMHSAYCTSKAAVLGLMRSWAVEWASDNILVNAICPGWVDTQMARDGVQGIANATGQSYESALKGQMQRVPLGKMSQPREIGALTKFLFSGEQTSITGEAFQINNGAVMH